MPRFRVGAYAYRNVCRNACRRLTSKTPAGASQAAPVLIHGKRSIKDGMAEEFQRHYSAYSKAMFEFPGIKAVYAFADKNEPLSFWHVIFARDVASFDSARARIAEAEVGMRLASMYTAPNDDDTLVLPRHVTAMCNTEGSKLTNPVLAMADMKRSYTPDTLNVYGSWSDLAAFWIDPSVRHVHRSRLAGYIKAEGAGQSGLPLFGFTRRHVKPSRMDGLAVSFQKVCDLWHERVPGILAATVHSEPEQPNVVHDVRIFANHEAFQAHTDKSDPELTAALEAWFDHYDTDEPFTGQLYYPATSASDGGLRASSIKDRPVRVGFDEFVFGQEGMLGPMPDMEKSW